VAAEAPLLLHLITQNNIKTSLKLQELSCQRKVAEAFQKQFPFHCEGYKN